MKMRNLVAAFDRFNTIQAEVELAKESLSHGGSSTTMAFKIERLESERDDLGDDLAQSKRHATALTAENQRLRKLLKEARKIVKASSSGRAGVHSDWMERTKDLA